MRLDGLRFRALGKKGAGKQRGSIVAGLLWMFPSCGTASMRVLQGIGGLPIFAPVLATALTFAGRSGRVQWGGFT